MTRHLQNAELMPWITVRYFPGFSYDLTSWETTIESSGALSQTVKISRFEPREERVERLITQLPPEQISKLRVLIAATDFTSVNETLQNLGIDDAECCEVTVHENGSVFRFAGPIDWWPFILQIGIGSHAHIVAAHRLWLTIDAMSPFDSRLKP